MSVATAFAMVQAYSSSERVLDGMLKIAVAELGAEASVRRHLRELYIKHVSVSTGENDMPPEHCHILAGCPVSVLICQLSRQKS